MRRISVVVGVALASWVFLVACSASGVGAEGTGVDSEAVLPALEPVDLGAGEKLRVVATTSIVGDVVAQVGGDLIELTTLIPPGQDPHTYEPTAQDIAQVEQAQVVFVNGLGLEEGLLNTVESVRGAPLVPVSAGIEPLEAGEGYHEGEDGEHEHAGADPHTWMDPTNVIVWTGNIAEALAALDPAHANTYQQNADAYAGELRDLDAYITERVAEIPPEQRKLVTNHEAFGYFARRYGFEVIGTVYIGAAQLAEPSAGDMARLIQTIREEGVRAIFIETTVSDALARTIAGEIGREVGVYTLYTGSLGEPGSGADSYIGMMRANIDTIVEGLAGP